MDGRDLAQAMDLEVVHFDQGHLGKGAHLGGVAGNELFHGLLRRGFLVA